MAKRRRNSPEQIITKLREAEVHLSQGKTVGQACKSLEISEQTYYRWRREYGGMDVTQARKLNHHDVLEVLTRLFLQKGVPVHIRSDNGAEFTAKRVRSWLANLQIKPMFIEPGTPCENGYIESFNGKMRGELLNGEIFYTLKEAEILIEMWRKDYNIVRPYSSLGYRPPVPAAIIVPTTQFQPVGLT